MRPRRSTFALGLLVGALLVWLLVRSRIPSPAPNPAADHALATTTPVATTDNLPAATTPPAGTPTVSDTTMVRSTATPAQARSNPPPGPSAAPDASVPVVTSTAAPNTESASINAIKVRRMITDYHTLTGENPVGTNAEIMAAVMGKNPRQATLGPPDGLSLNGNGELVDEWGTPYFFHQLSRDVMEIHSAGPDKIMGTADDVIVR